MAFYRYANNRLENSSYIPALTVGVLTASDDAEKADLLARHFSAQFNTDKPQTPQLNPFDVKYEDGPLSFSEHVILFHLSRVKSKWSHTPDGFPGANSPFSS